MRPRPRQKDVPRFTFLHRLEENVSKDMLAQVILVILCLACYQHSLDGAFVFDDTVAIEKNPDVVKTPTNLTAIFEHDFWGAPLKDVDSHKSYRPLTTLMFHFEYKQGLRAKHMKAINLFFHCINTLLIWRLIYNLKFKQEATVTSALFAIHPVHTEAVCGVVGRAELMFCFIYLMAMQLTHLRKHLKVVADILVISLTFIGIFFKETAITIPLTCVFLDYLCTRVYMKPLKQQLRMVLNLRYLGYGAATILLIIFRFAIQNFESPQFKPMDNPLAFSGDLLTKILTQQFLYVINLWILFCPTWLCFDWAIGCIDLITSIWDLRLQSVLALYSFVIVACIKYKPNFGIMLGVGMLVIPFIPASGIIRVGFVIAERVLYVPSIGFCFLVAYSFIKLKRSIQRNFIVLTLKICLMFLCICFIVRTRERASEWENEEKLFSSALKVCPNNAKVHFNIARLASDKKQHNKAMYHYHKAVELYPEYEAALMNLGNMYREKGDLNTAEKFIRAAISAMPEFPAAWMNLGIIQSARNEFEEALSSYKTALKFRKNYGICHYNIGNLYLDQNLYTEAMHHWQQAVAINPRQSKAWANILTMLDNRGLFEDAIRVTGEALKHMPNETAIMFIRANAFGKLKHYVQAELLYKKIIELEPYNHLYHTNLGVLYHRWGKIDLAISSYQHALQCNAGVDSTAHENLTKLLKRKLNDELQLTDTE
ncbi:protein O-mannosyl-transferase TMTC4 [Teleopsis dalmanni]|uniref:protein O-mannosyl-transferase TMTC4 n=1 Tax=Teleopsis dalmanni TaxID=139649 RepID=UPI000D32A02A|nr:protein O-mannosyl-transferase TMTC4 [Teleopsis dalmanni]